MHHKLSTALVVLVAAAIGLGCSSEIDQPGSAEETGTLRHIQFTYDVVLDTFPADAETVEVYIPLPQSNAIQTLATYDVMTSLNTSVIDVDGNQALRLIGDIDTTTGTAITVELLVTRYEYQGLEGSADSLSPEMRERYLAPDSLVPISGQVAAEADSVLSGVTGDLSKARALYDHLFSTMSYDKSGDGWGRGDAIWACNSRRGNCTDIHSVFIGMARSQGIPARFTIGFPTPNDTAGTVSGYHCWAEFWADEHGWVPVDISEAIKHPDKKDYFFGTLDYDRISFTTGRDLILDLSDGDQVLNYFIYPVVRVDGQPYSQFTTAYAYRHAVGIDNLGDIQ